MERSGNKLIFDETERSIAHVPAEISDEFAPILQSVLRHQAELRLKQIQEIRNGVSDAFIGTIPEHEAGLLTIAGILQGLNIQTKE